MKGIVTITMLEFLLRIEYLGLGAVVTTGLLLQCTHSTTVYYDNVLRSTLSATQLYGSLVDGY